MAGDRKRVYLVVMLLGGVALVVDRFVLSSNVTVPASVVAGSPRPSATGPAALPMPAPTKPIAATPGALPVADRSVPELPFPRNMPNWDGQTPIADIFAPRGGNAATDKALRHAKGDEDAARGTCAVWVRQHRLDAVMAQERLKIAVVDGASLRIGDALDGCSLIAVEGTKARFRCRDGETSLTLSPAPATTAP